MAGVDALLQLLTTLEAQGTSGEVEVAAPIGEGLIWFSQGQIVDALFGTASGLPALFRMLALVELELEVHYQPVGREPAIALSVPELMEAWRKRAETWRELLKRVPPLDSVLAIDGRRFMQVRTELADSEFKLLAFFDRRRSLLEVIDECGLDAVAALERVVQYVELGLVKLDPRSPSGFPVRDEVTSSPQASEQPTQPRAAPLPLRPDSSPEDFDGPTEVADPFPTAPSAAPLATPAQSAATGDSGIRISLIVGLGAAADPSAAPPTNARPAAVERKQPDAATERGAPRPSTSPQLDGRDDET